MNEDEYTFGIGDRVLVGTTEGVVEGQKNERGFPDSFVISFPDEDGFPYRREFFEHDIQKARSH